MNMVGVLRLGRDNSFLNLLFLGFCLEMVILAVSRFSIVLLDNKFSWTFLFMDY